MSDQNKNIRSYISMAVSAVLLTASAYLFWSAAATQSQPSTVTLAGSGNDAFRCLGGNFVLQSAKGPVQLSDFKGKVVVLYFGYATCPDVCPTSLGLLSLGLQKLTPEELKKIQVLFISVDPERDTVERLENYAKAFHANIEGITGTPEEIASIAKHYGVMYQKVEMNNSALGYAVDHSSRYYVIGKDSRVKKFIEHGTSPEEIVSVLRTVL